MVNVGFEEIRLLLQAKVVRMVAVRSDNVSDDMIAQTFFISDKLSELKHFCRVQYGNQIPFEEVNRIEGRFLPQMIDEVVKILSRKEYLNDGKFAVYHDGDVVRTFDNESSAYYHMECLIKEDPSSHRVKDLYVADYPPKRMGESGRGMNVVTVGFEEIRQLLQSKVVRVVAARLENVNEGMIVESFNASDRLFEARNYCRTRYGNQIPFLEVNRIEDRFLMQLIEEVTKDLDRKE